MNINHTSKNSKSNQNHHLFISHQYLDLMSPYSPLLPSTWLANSIPTMGNGEKRNSAGRAGHHLTSSPYKLCPYQSQLSRGFEGTKSFARKIRAKPCGRNLSHSSSFSFCQVQSATLFSSESQLRAVRCTL